MMLIIRNEVESDFPVMRQINDAAFGGIAESQLVESMREGGFARISLVAVIDDKVVGHILFSELQIVTASATVPALSLAPMSVLPDYQSQGIGSELVRA